MQVHNFPFFFGMTTIRKSQVVSSIEIMNMTTSNLSKYCFTIDASLGFILYVPSLMGWWDNGI
jgi:hypothetical protein